jgi:type IV secretion system protein VirB11
MTSPAAPLLQHLMQPLALWLDDDATEDIAINEPGRAWVRHHGVWDAVELPLTLADLEDIAVLAGSLRRQEVAPLAPLCATELPGGERLQICIPPCVPQGTVALSIRKPEQGVAPLSEINNRYQTADWNRCRAARAERDLDPLLALYDTAELGRFLAAATRGKLNILLCGQTGAGKTTLSKSILAAIPDTERLITIEDTLELTISQPNNVRLLYSKDDRDGTQVGAEDLLQASLRMRPDRVLLQELRDDAAWTYLTSICSGHPGSVTTIHGRDAGDALRRLFLLVKASPAGRAMERDAIVELIAASIDVILPLFMLAPDQDKRIGIGAVWFAAAAAGRGETAGDLLRAA